MIGPLSSLCPASGGGLVAIGQQEAKLVHGVFPLSHFDVVGNGRLTRLAERAVLLQLTLDLEVEALRLLRVVAKFAKSCLDFFTTRNANDDDVADPLEREVFEVPDQPSELADLLVIRIFGGEVFTQRPHEDEDRRGRTPVLGDEGSSLLGSREHLCRHTVEQVPNEHGDVASDHAFFCVVGHHRFFRGNGSVLKHDLSLFLFRFCFLCGSKTKQSSLDCLAYEKTELLNAFIVSTTLEIS